VQRRKNIKVGKMLYCDVDVDIKGNTVCAWAEV
jgi:hypothetical protein